MFTFLHCVNYFFTDTPAAAAAAAAATDDDDEDGGGGVVMVVRMMKIIMMNDDHDAADDDDDDDDDGDHAMMDIVWFQKIPIPHPWIAFYFEAPWALLRKFQFSFILSFKKFGL